ncbi:hypothetical protein [Ruegeria sp. HKCCSP351]|uniref:hypothetical protein n=1 Tax=Ruegeria sp. HKCCSP351 TaxID=2794832 RepID=UPI001AE73E00|nr:hypothetical protein [Ruegeria sp. HKCCSP351]
MPITITQEGYARACGVVRNTACARLKNIVPATSGLPKRYYVAAVLPTLTARERAGEAVRSLIDVADLEDTLFVGDDVIPVCQAFEGWLDDEQRQRLLDCRVDFTAALYNTTVSSEIWQFIDALHLKLCLHPGICRFVTTGDDADLPDFEHFAFSFALANARHFESLSSKEAA